VHVRYAISASLSAVVDQQQVRIVKKHRALLRLSADTGDVGRTGHRSKPPGGFVLLPGSMDAMVSRSD
jgi:hypothetical protein